MSLSVIIPSRSASNLTQCVHAVRRNEPDIDIIAVSDGGVRNRLADLPVRWVDGIEPFVYARNVNLGIQAAGNNDVILLNDDALLRTKSGLLGMQCVAESHRDIGVLSAGIRGAVCNVNQQPRQPSSLRYDRTILAFVCVLIPRTILDIVGMLDERFTGYGEDDRDYCIRVMLTGLQLAIWDGCIVDHNELPSSFRTRPDWQGMYRQNQMLFRQKWSREP